MDRMISVGPLIDRLIGWTIRTPSASEPWPNRNLIYSLFCTRYRRADQVLSAIFPLIVEFKKLMPPQHWSSRYGHMREYCDDVYPPFATLMMMPSFKQCQKTVGSLLFIQMRIDEVDINTKSFGYLYIHA